MQNISSLALKLWEIFEAKDGRTKSLEQDPACLWRFLNFSIFQNARILNCGYVNPYSGVKPKRRSRNSYKRRISSLVAERHLPVSQETIEIFDEHGQRVGNERSGAADVKETMM